MNLEKQSFIKRGLMMAAVLLSVGYLGRSAVYADEAEYSCCGNKNCTLLAPEHACPGGSAENCPKINEEEKTCCILRCNDPSQN